MSKPTATPEHVVPNRASHSAPTYAEVGCRIPKDYFWVIGWGESDVGIETGSYDAALTMAGIENYNVMLYTSVLPPEAVELRHLPDIHHGSVLEGILAIQHTERPGTRITTGVLLARVHRKSDNSLLGGFACEYAGHGTLEEAQANLRQAMNELFARRYSPALHTLHFGKTVVRTFTPQKSFGTILVGIGFASYLVPVVSTEVDITPAHKDKSHVKYSTG
jgi:arginine decarboxylase